MSANTHKFNLPSGPEVEVIEMTGKHQRILTEQKNKQPGENINEVIADVLVRVGSNTNIDVKFVEQMLSADRKKVLTEARQFTMDFDPDFVFTFDYISKRTSKKEQFTYEANLADGFPARALQVPNENFDKTQEVSEDNPKYVDATYKEYGDIERKQKLVLPRSGMNVQWQLLDGIQEGKFAKLPKNKRSSHTAIEMHNPVYFDMTDDVVSDTPIQLNLDKLSFKDIEALRTHIKAIEGGIDTEIMFTHPEADMLPRREQEVVIDVTNEVAFYFPSEAV